MSSTPYKYGGANAMVALHATHLRHFLEIWRRAELRGITLPESSDPNYESLDVLLHHVMRCGAHYLRWICKQLDIPDPDIDERPGPAGFSSRAEEYMEEVLAAWELPLRQMTVEQAEPEVYASNWGTLYCIDAMLEHAVMHPIRHSHQLEQLMAGQ